MPPKNRNKNDGGGSGTTNEKDGYRAPGVWAKTKTKEEREDHDVVTDLPESFDSLKVEDASEVFEKTEADEIETGDGNELENPWLSKHNAKHIQRLKTKRLPLPVPEIITPQDD
ncbi:hypothetical protein EK21DRAFT_116698 [Setomelanomma holmii]|uniref:Uncharacterized protein n=1 Tax=Setomelanomma holmii TaxID=210430 RepID=A0A9P4LIF0_9PLEO|nr:hypothetical protein EK21DRAFT_116698 [Setomelanomma holmii]